MNKSQTAREQAIEVGLSLREAEWRLDTELFLDEYPRWELGAPHCSVIFHVMFLTCYWVRVERGGEVHLPRPPGQSAKAWPRGRPTCHKTSGVSDFSWGAPGPLSQCLPVEKIPGSPTLWATMEKGSNLWHSLLPKELVALMGVPHPSQRRHKRACRQTSSLGLGEGKTHIRKPSGRPGQLSRGC